MTEKPVNSSSGSRPPAGAGRGRRRSASTSARSGSATPAGKRSKYNAKGRHVGTVWCASDAEAVRYEQLLAMQEKGLVSHLEPQPSLPCTVNGVKICTYRADFRYRWHGEEVRDPHGIVLVEEVKGLETPEWKLKKRLVEALYCMKIGVIRKPRNRAQIEEENPELLGPMTGQMGNFSRWITLRWADRVPGAE